MNSKLIKTLSLATLLAITGCASTNETSDTSVVASTDTTKPVITLVSASVNVETGTKYSAKDNIKSVTDDTDGILEYAKKATDDSAYYLIDDGKLDTSKAGTYKIKVTASDKSGNTATKDFDVIVKDSEKKETTKSDSAKTESSTKAESKSSKSDSKTASQKASTSTKKATTSSSSSNTNQSQSTDNSTSQNTQNTQSTQTCKTVHHDATGHYEQKLKTAAWDESVYDGTKVKCNACGEIFSGDAEYLAHSNYYHELWNAQYNETGDPEQTDKSLLAHGSSTVVPVYRNVHHDAEYESVWVADTAAYDETVCS